LPKTSADGSHAAGSDTGAERCPVVFVCPAVPPSECFFGLDEAATHVRTENSSQGRSRWLEHQSKRLLKVSQVPYPSFINNPASAVGGETRLIADPNYRIARAFLSYRLVMSGKCPRTSMALSFPCVSVLHGLRYGVQ
jgi:hypothetical protein